MKVPSRNATDIVKCGREELSKLSC